MVPVQTCSKMDKAAFLGNNWTKLTAINDQKTCAIRLTMCVQLVLRKGSDLIWSHTTTPLVMMLMMISMMVMILMLLIDYKKYDYDDDDAYDEKHDENDYCDDIEDNDEEGDDDEV